MSGVDRTPLGSRINRFGKKFASTGDVSGFAVLFYFIVFVLISAWLLIRNIGWTTAAWDTKHFFTFLRYMERTSPGFTLAPVDPLQGMFDFYPDGVLPGLLPNVFNWFGGLGTNSTFFFLVCSLFMAIAVYAFARTVGFERGVSVIAAFVWPGVVMPWALASPFAAHFYLLAPPAYYVAATAVVMSTLYWRIGRGSLRQSILLTAAISLILVYVSVSQAAFMSVTFPTVAALGIGALFACRSRNELKVKIVAAFAILMAYTASGIPFYLNVVGSYTAFNVFNEELRNAINMGVPNFGRSFLVMFVDFLRLNGFPAERNLVLAALAGLFFFELAGPRRDIRIVARTMLIWIAIMASAFHFVHYGYYYFGIIYKGPWWHHFSFIFWPYYSIFIAALGVALLRGAISLAARSLPRLRATCPHVPQAIVVVGLVWFFSYFTAVYEPYGREWGEETVQTPVTEFLSDRIEFAYDQPFRGRVISFPTRAIERSGDVQMGALNGAYYTAFHHLGNDLGYFGFWDLNIPTLFSWTHTTTPQFFLLTSELLSRPGIDRQTRSYRLMTIPQENILALFGVRYAVVDKDMDLGTERFVWELEGRFSQAMRGSGSFRNEIRVRELDNPNLGNYSPTEVVSVKTADDVLDGMRAPGFDGARTVFVEGGLDGEFVQVEDAVMSVVEGGLHVSASSAGESLLVLPAQYSHCWQTENTGTAQLFRANLGMLGIRFSGELDIELRQVFGPFFQHGCRWEDMADTERLDMHAAREANGEDPYYAPYLPELRRGDGKNLLTLEDAQYSEANVSLVFPEVGEGEDAIYRLIANSEDTTEHYLNTGFVGVEPGVHTLSFWVQEGSVEEVRLQFLDGNSRGVLADFNVVQNTAVPHAWGQPNVRARAARLAEREDGWTRVALTVDIETQKAYAVIQLSLGAGRVIFKASGQELVFKGLRLEKGEVPGVPSGP